MRERLPWLWAVLLGAALLTGGGCNPGAGGAVSSEWQRFEGSHFGFFRALNSYPLVSELGVHWERPHPGPFIWGEIERQEGSYDFSQVDSYLQAAQSHEVILVATIWPYANWDQERCHEKLPDERRLFPILGDYRGKPCDPAAYRRFVEALVERYDGDGQGDMPGLVYPIKYWEIDNEPDIDRGPVFFKGDPQTGDYLELLTDSHTAIKAADPAAKILNGGIAFLGDGGQAFWRAVLDSGAQYVDVMSIHSITSGTALQLDAMFPFMAAQSLDKPVWVTEIQYAKSRRLLQASGLAPAAPAGNVSQGLVNLSEEEWASVLVKSYVEAFGRGADKLFYIGLDNSVPSEEGSLLIACQERTGSEPGAPFDPAGCRRQKLFFAFQTMIAQIDYFDGAQKLAEGQYRFSVGGRAVYVLWGKQPLPPELKGRVELTAIDGSRSEVEAGAVVLTEVPIFVELAG